MFCFSKHFAISIESDPYPKALTTPRNLVVLEILLLEIKKFETRFFKQLILKVGIIIQLIFSF